MEQAFPERVLIPIDAAVGNLYILHASRFCREGFDVPKGTTIGRYLVRFEDGSEQSITVACGEDVRDWTWDGRPLRRPGRVPVGSRATTVAKSTLSLCVGKPASREEDRIHRLRFHEN